MARILERLLSNIAYLLSFCCCCCSHNPRRGTPELQEEHHHVRLRRCVDGMLVSPQREEHVRRPRLEPLLLFLVLRVLLHGRRHLHPDRAAVRVQAHPACGVCDGLGRVLPRLPSVACLGLARRPPRGPPATHGPFPNCSHLCPLRDFPSPPEMLPSFSCMGACREDSGTTHVNYERLANSEYASLLSQRSEVSIVSPPGRPNFGRICANSRRRRP